MVPAEEGDQPPPVRGIRPRWRWKSPTTACTAQAVLDRPAMPPRPAGSPRSRRRARSRSSRPRPASRREQAGLVRGARAELDQRRRAGEAGDVTGVGGQDRPLGPGRVVLVEAGDLVEEVAAPLVVEPDRGQRPSGVAVRPSAVSASRASAQSAASRWTSTATVALIGRPPSPRASRRPGEGPPGAGREEVPVGRPHVAGGVTHDPPRRTCWLDHELAVVLTDRAGGGRNPG